MKATISISLENLSDFIRRRRKDLGLTQKQLGDLLGIDQRSVSALEKKPQSISAGRLFALMEALQIRLEASEVVGEKDLAH